MPLLSTTGVQGRTRRSGYDIGLSGGITAGAASSGLRTIEV